MNMTWSSGPCYHEWKLLAGNTEGGPLAHFLFLGGFFAKVAEREAQRDRVRPVAERVARSYGLEIFDVQFRRESHGWVLRVVIDRPYADGEAAPVPEPGAPEQELRWNPASPA